MICPNCDTHNRDHARYCLRCGWWLLPRCPSCHEEIPAGVFFCDQCGLRLAGQTTTTDQHTHISGQPEPQPILAGRPESPGQGLQQYIPKELMSKLEAARASDAMAGERRIVTMLFCDIKGSTAAAEQLDPEEWTEIINGAFEHMIKPVYHYEGTVARLMGDAILAFFGAPIAHEDDPQRAVLAGLDIVAGIRPYGQEIHRRWGLDLNVRVGINTGMVVAGAVGSDLRMEYTAMGDAINLASRMEQTAEPGTVQIAHDTYKLVAPLFEFEDLGAIPIKGKDEPVPTYRVLRRKAMPGRLRGFGGASVPLVGHQEPRRKLLATLEQLHHGNGQIVCIIGEVGLGKSRLIRELRREWDKTMTLPAGEIQDRSPVFARWYETFSLSYETTRPYGLFQNFLRQVLGATQADPPVTLLAKVDSFLDTTVPLERREGIGAVLKTLFGLAEQEDVGPEGEAFKTQLFETITDLVSLWIGDRPGVMVCDDVHWSDPASVDLLTHLFKLSDRLPILILCVLRPDRSAPGWELTSIADRDYSHHYTEIRLEALSRQDSYTLLKKLLMVDELSESLREGILAKAAGNPLFIEEVVRGLIDNGSFVPGIDGKGWRLAPAFEVTSIDIPDSLHSLLMARIDRLAEAERHTLQLAAIIGRSFTYRVLNFIIQTTDNQAGPASGALDNQLDKLKRLDLIIQVTRIPELGFMFRQALVQEVTYKTILRRKRRGYHRLVGEAIESLFPDQVDEQANFLAYHFSRAEDHARALKYHTLAGDNAYRLFANAEAEKQYALALDAAQISSAPTGQLIYLFSRRGRALELDARINEAADLYKAMEQRAVTLGEKEMELEALIPLGTLYCTATSLFDPEQGEVLSRRALVLARDSGNRAAEAKILWNLLNVNRFSSRPEQAMEHGESSLAIARELDLREQMAFTLSDLCHLYNRVGRYDKSKASLKETLALWREIGNRPMLADNLSTAGYVHAYTGDFDEAIAFSKEALEISESVRSVWGISYSQWVVGTVFWMRGEVDRAIQAMGACIEYGQEAGFVGANVYTRSDLGLVFAELGDLERGLDMIESAVRFTEKGHVQWRPYALSQLARLHLMAGDQAAAGKAIDESKSSSRPFHIVKPNMATLAECQWLIAQDRMPEAIQLLEGRLDDLRRYGLKLTLVETTYLLGMSRLATGRRDEALAVLKKARTIAQSMGEKRISWQILTAIAALTTGERASEHLSEARQIIDFITANTEDPDLRRSFLARPDVAALMMAG